MAALPLAAPAKISTPLQPPPTTAAFSGSEASALSLVRRCRTTGELRQFHAILLKTGGLHHAGIAEAFLESVVTHVPSALPYACKLFDEMPSRTNFLYNVMIRGLASAARHGDALALLARMPDDSVAPNDHTFSCLLKACSRARAAAEGRQVHGLAVKSGFSGQHFVQNTLIRLYGSCGETGTARKVFDAMLQRSCASWYAMVAGYFDTESWAELLQLFHELVELEPSFIDEAMLIRALTACARTGDVETGEWLRCFAEENGMMGKMNLDTTFITMYAKCGLVDRARELFDKAPGRDVVTWSAMISGYMQANRCMEALELFSTMRACGIEPNEVTMVAVLAACAVLGALDTGRWVHIFLRRKKMVLTVELGTALVDFYAKCGDVSSSLKVFEEMPSRNVYTWAALIQGLANNGQGRKALAIFSTMLETEVQPTEAVFVSVLSACSHAGLVEEGRHHFASMTSDYGIVPRIDHYGCMVDMLGRAGLLDEVYCFIKEMPIDPNAIIWRTLLASCKVHKNAEIGEACLREIARLEPTHSGDYILLSNIYASVGRWDDAVRLRSHLKIKGIKKSPGCSLVEVEGVIYEFFAEDTKHPQSKEIYEKVEEMLERIKMAGYVANTAEARLDAEEDDKETSVSHHSEKLAVAFALIRSSGGAPIRISKNVRICTDCHLAFKLVSRVYNREIIARDRSVFHHFKDGCCSCNDYW